MPRIAVHCCLFLHLPALLFVDILSAINFNDAFNLTRAINHPRSITLHWVHGAFNESHSAFINKKGQETRLVQCARSKPFRRARKQDKKRAQLDRLRIYRISFTGAPRSLRLKKQKKRIPRKKNFSRLSCGHKIPFFSPLAWRSSKRAKMKNDVVSLDQCSWCWSASLDDDEASGPSWHMNESQADVGPLLMSRGCWIYEQSDLKWRCAGSSHHSEALWDAELWNHLKWLPNAIKACCMSEWCD